MPRARCRFYDENGSPINGGCKKVGICTFVHPSEPGWSSAVPAKATSSAQHTASSGNKRRQSDSGFGNERGGGGSRPWGSGRADQAVTGTNTIPVANSTWGFGANCSSSGTDLASSTWGGLPETSGNAAATGKSPWAETTFNWGESTWGDNATTTPNSAASSGWTNTHWGGDLSGVTGWGNSELVEPATPWGAAPPTASWWSEEKAETSTATEKGKGREIDTGIGAELKSPGETFSPANDAWTASTSDPWGEPTTSTWETQATTKKPTWGDSPATGATPNPARSTWGMPSVTARATSPVAVSANPTASARDKSDSDWGNSSTAGRGHNETENLHNDDGTTDDVMEQDTPDTPIFDSMPTHNRQTASRHASVVSSSSKRSAASVDSNQVPTLVDYVHTLVKAVQCQCSSDHEETAQAQYKTVQRSKAYTKAGPRAVEKLEELIKEQSLKTSHALRHRDHAAMQFMNVAERFHRNPIASLGLTEADMENSTDFMESLEEVKAWIDRAWSIYGFSANERAVESFLDKDSSLDRSTAWRQVDERLSKTEDRAESLISYLQWLVEENQQTVNHCMEERLRFLPSITRNKEESLRIERILATKSRQEASLRNVRQTVQSVDTRVGRMKANQLLLLAEHSTLLASFEKCKEVNTAQERRLQSNSAEIEDIKARFKEVEARKPEPASIDPVFLSTQLLPAMILTAHADMSHTREDIVKGMDEYLAKYQKQIADALWQKLDPVIQLTSTIQQLIDEHSVQAMVQR